MKIKITFKANEAAHAARIREAVRILHPSAREHHSAAQDGTKVTYFSVKNVEQRAESCPLGENMV